MLEPGELSNIEHVSIEVDKIIILAILNCLDYSVKK